MRPSSLLWRSTLAILLTGVTSALIVSLGWVIVGSVIATRVEPARVWSFLPVVWLFGSLVATAFALILGLLIELPKTFWAKRRHSDGRWLTQFAISVSAGIVLTVVATFVDVISRNLVAPSASAATMAFLHNAAAGANAASAQHSFGGGS